jgi:hypothetical protein
VSYERLATREGTVPALRVLFADDEIPYGNARDDARRAQILTHDPSVDDERYDMVTREMRSAVIALEAAGFDVTVGRSISESLRLIAREEFDVAIIDLGWWGDGEVDVDKRPAAGWQLIRALDARAERTKQQRPPTIMYSMRYLDDNALTMEAVNGGTLPLPKNYTDASHQTLVAAVEYLGRAAAAPGPAERTLQRANLDAWEAAGNRLELAFRVMLVCVVVIVAADVGMVIFGVVSGTAVGVLQAAAAILTGIFSSVLLVLYRRLGREADAARRSASHSISGRAADGRGNGTTPAAPERHGGR